MLDSNKSECFESFEEQNAHLKLKNDTEQVYEIAGHRIKLTREIISQISVE